MSPQTNSKATDFSLSPGKYSRSRICAQAILWLFLFTGNALATHLSESEPNSLPTQPDSIVCGDTVMCAGIHPANDLDYYCCFVNNGDSLIATTFDCNGSAVNTFLVLFDAQDSVLATDNNNGSALFSCIRYAVHQSGYYKIRVMGLDITTDSTYCLSLRCQIPIPEEFDFCSSPRLITEFPYFDEGTTYGATHQLGTPSRDVFYKFSNPIASDYLIEVCTTIFDARVQLLGNCTNDYREDESLGCGLGATLPLFALPPGDYFIMVEGMTALQFGSYSITVTAELPECPAPDSVILTRVGGLPFLDWPQLHGPMYYIVWQATNSEGPWEHYDISFLTFYTDSLGFSATKRFYRITSVCPW